MRVLACDPYMSPAVAADLGIEMLELGDLLPRVDLLTLHLPLTDATYHLVDGAALQRMKPGGKSKLVCPSDIAYGDRGSPPKIKPGAALLFEVELLEVEAPAKK